VEASIKPGEVQAAVSGVQAVLVRGIVLRVVRSVWAAAISAAFFGLP
jgi:hypothetical protein